MNYAMDSASFFRRLQSEVKMFRTSAHQNRVLLPHLTRHYNSSHPEFPEQPGVTPDQEV